MNTNAYEPLSREEVIKAVERKNPSRIPMILANWWGEGLREQYGDKLNEFSRYPQDAIQLSVPALDYGKMNLSWELPKTGGHDGRTVIDDWSKLDEFIEKMPDPLNDPMFNTYFEDLAKRTKDARNKNQYVLFSIWHFMFERPWSIRGMENLMIDYYTEQENVHRLHTALCKHFCGLINRAKAELSPDGFFTSDDLGHQTQSMMSPDIFAELIYPYYKTVGDVLKKNAMHWWLHSCGNNTELMPQLIDAGVTVFHPVQKGTMDEIETAHRFGDRITFLAGIDVQHTLQEKNPQGVREEVRFLIDTFDKPNGGMCIAAGNGIVSGTPYDNIGAFLDEAYHYGIKHRKQMASLRQQEKASAAAC